MCVIFSIPNRRQQNKAKNEMKLFRRLLSHNTTNGKSSRISSSTSKRNLLFTTTTSSQHNSHPNTMASFTVTYVSRKSPGRWLHGIRGGTRKELNRKNRPRSLCFVLIPSGRYSLITLLNFYPCHLCSSLAPSLFLSLFLPPPSLQTQKSRN